MMSGFRKPSSGWLCFLSLLWIVIGFWAGGRFALRGNYIGSGIMFVFGLVAAGLWFQSKISAWVLIVCACVGSVYTVFHIGHIPTIRVIMRLLWAVVSIAALVEFIKEPRRE